MKDLDDAGRAYGKEPEIVLRYMAGKTVYQAHECLNLGILEKIEYFRSRFFSTR
jgi:hypothetical protein